MSTANEQPKILFWLSGEVKSPPFSKAARHEVGMLFRRLQGGEMLGMPHSRPMPGIGRRCHELRIPDGERNWRIFYRIDADTIVIAEVFHKTTQQTPKAVVDRCKARFKRYDQYA